MEILISTLISIVIGVGLMEAYAWLDPLAKWLVRRAGQQLPEENREEFTEQFLADVNAMPNSVAKVVFAFRNCTLAINDINDAIYRKTFESIADVDTFRDHMVRGRDELLKKSEDLIRYCETSGVQLISKLNFCLERLENPNQNKDAQAAIDHARKLAPRLAQQVSDHNSRLARHHALIRRFGTRRPIP